MKKMKNTKTDNAYFQFYDNRIGKCLMGLSYNRKAYKVIDRDFKILGYIRWSSNDKKYVFETYVVTLNYKQLENIAKLVKQVTLENENKKGKEK